MHPLDGAYQRVSWARKRFGHLKRLASAYRQRKIDGIVVERSPQTLTLPTGQQIGFVLGTAKVPSDPVPHSLSILIGEVVYNLRAALDYLIYELARSDAKKNIQGTQFPIENSEDYFDNTRRPTYLRGVSDTHVAAIKKLQPFNGCDWTESLRNLSNPDKHMRLTYIASPLTFDLPEGSTQAILAGHEVDVKDGVSVEITFSDGTPIIESLQQLLPEVAKTLDAFKPEI